MDEEWLGSDIPQISPDAKFREELHRALQSSYQRQQAQYELRRQRHPLLRMPGLVLSVLGLLALMITIVCLLHIVVYRGRRQRCLNLHR